MKSPLSISKCLYSASSGEALVARLSSILKDCSESPDLHKTRQAHTQIIVHGTGDAGLLGTKVLGAYVHCRSLVDAKNTFLRLEKSRSVTWNWMIRGFTMMGMFKFAVLMYFKMLGCGVSPDRYTFPYVIKSCSGLSALGIGKSVHERICLMGLEIDVFVGSCLIKMYMESGCVREARRMFDEMSERDCVLWNVMIDGYVKNGDNGEALELFSAMRRSGTPPNLVTFACVLSVCASGGLISYGDQLHGLVIRCGLELEVSVANTLLAMYAKFRCLPDMRRLLDLMPQTDRVTWNGMISGCVQNGFMGDALELFYKMQSAGIKPDSITLTSFLPSLADSDYIAQGREIHAYIVRNDVHLDAYLKSALIDIYFKCGDVEMAHTVFNQSGAKDMVICSAMISGYVRNGMCSEALKMFRWLISAKIKPNSVTLASVLPACSSLAALRLGKELHSYIIKHAFDRKCYVASALSDMYAKCGRLDLGYHVFTRMSERDTMAWNSMITNLTHNGQFEEAISHFRQMGWAGMRYDCVTVSSALSACANLTALRFGKEIHGFMIKGGISSDHYSESALIDMYAKCGNVVSSRHVFDLMHGRNEVSWNSIISAYGNYGLIEDAANLLEEMETEELKPDHITFLAMISACSHAGLVKEGLRYFRIMTEGCKIAARMEHYACMVDLLGRAGQLNEAMSFITSMPFKPDAGIWGALLGACRVHGNVELAEIASKHLFELDPQNSGYYVLMSNINAVAGRWEGVLKVRSLMKKRRVQKLPGCSWIVINGKNHMFIAADKDHPDCAQIYSLYETLLLDLIEAGYVPQAEIVYPPLSSNRHHVCDFFVAHGYENERLECFG